MSDVLLSKKCIPCNIGTPPLTSVEIDKYKKELKLEWIVIDDKKIERDFSFKDFEEALKFVNKVGEIAEREQHHPDIYLHSWRKVKIELMTHKIKGLSENDFILAAKIEELFN